MGEISISELLKLPGAERIRIVEALWDSVAANPESLELSEAERTEIDRRWAEYQRDPSAGSSWSEVRARILRNG